MQTQSGGYPWYDSKWLRHFAAAQAIIREVCPDRLEEFVRAFDVFRTPPDFQVRELPRVFDEAVMERIRTTAKSFAIGELEMHELKTFGRFVVHDLPYFNELQREIVPLVSELVGEEVEPMYNFLAMYTKLGVCAVHMDAPEAKWTLDLCIEQSDIWPIHFSGVKPWPIDYAPEEPWEDSVRRDAAPFSAHALEPGQALIFSGSSQWHFRDPLPQDGREHHCNLLFFHFVPKGSRRLVRVRNWAELFGIPELASIEGVP
jgi:hypothetical protein